jgi:hypothetical protein
MANYQVARVNRLLDDAKTLVDFWSGAYLSRVNGMPQSAQSMTWFRIPDPCFSIVYGYRKIEDEKKNEDVLIRATSQMLSSAHASGASPVFFVTGSPEGMNVLISTGSSVEGVEKAFKAVPQLSVDSTLRRVRSAAGAHSYHGGIITGFPAGAKLDMDYILDRMEGKSYRFAVVASPTPRASIQQMSDWMREIQSEYESILPGNGRGGSIHSKMSQIATPEVDELLDVLWDCRTTLAAASAKEVFTAYIVYQSKDASTTAELANAIMGALSIPKESSGNPLVFPVQGMTGTSELFSISELFLWCPNGLNRVFSVGLPFVLADTMTVAGLFASPRRTHRGFSVLETSIDSTAPNTFNTYTSNRQVDSIRLGVIDGSGIPFSIPVNQLSKHVLIAATTGGGKTNTAFQIIESVAKRDIPVLMLVPSMKNYRELAPRLGNACIYSRDSEEYPLRLNIMQPEPDVIVADHLKDLMVCIKGAFGSEMEQVIVVNFEALFEYTYRDFGIDINTMSNMYSTWPTLSDARRLLTEFRKTMLYGDETGTDVTGAINARLAKLTRGTAGMILNNTQNLCGADFCEGNVLVEEDELGLESKPFTTSFILACRVNKYLRREELKRDLKHLVVEEAHQVFVRAPDGDRKDNPEAVASKYFEEMLSQASNYGTGMVIVEQLPHRLGKSAIGNTNTKIVGKLDLSEDIEAVSTALRLNPYQREMLPFLSTGELVVAMGGSPEVCKVICDRVKE